MLGISIGAKITGIETEWVQEAFRKVGDPNLSGTSNLAIGLQKQDAVEAVSTGSGLYDLKSSANPTAFCATSIRIQS